MKSYILIVILCLLTGIRVSAQGCYWQQHVDYKIDADLDVQNSRYTGHIKLAYKNNSPDTLTQVFFHLYPNAFHPNSMMDMRSRTIIDPDRRVGDRILGLSESDRGYLHVRNFKQEGKSLNPTEIETILQVALDKAISPGASTTFELDFEGQVPSQIRRSGRDNKEGVRYSMSQWYPKLCEYDVHGWHATPYIGREFHGVWGSFDVNLKLDASYIVAATGLLQNADEVGFGYEKEGAKVKKKESGKLDWHWRADNVHDFVWAADPDYKHIVRKMADGPELHFFYQPGATTEDWDKLPAYTEQAFQVMAKRFGAYPYTKFSVIQGGDGGMEYPMATLITGQRDIEDLVGVTVHEMIHSWYQGVLATDESLYPWMDEGFTSYAESEVIAAILSNGKDEDPHLAAYSSYFSLVTAGLQEPMTTHADHYKTNRAYGTNAYSKGELALAQLRGVIGEETLEKALRRYFREWKFKHPTVTDFKRCAEKESGMELDWYFDYWVHTNEVIDYSVGQVVESDGKTYVEIRRIGNMPMPLFVNVGYRGGKSEIHYLPLTIMYGRMPLTAKNIVNQEAWPWTHPSYVIVLPVSKADLLSVEIDPGRFMADVNRANNVYQERQLVPGPGK
jgi:Peptidase family M1 domain